MKKENLPGTDYLNGDHSFKMWLKIQWKNGYLAMALLGLAGVAGTPWMTFDQTWEYVTWLFIFGTMAFVCIYLGWFRFWNYLRGKRKNP